MTDPKEKVKDHYVIESWKKWAFGIFFVLIAGLLVYIAFFSGSTGTEGASTTGNFFSSITGGFSLTGGVISEEDLESPIGISADLEIPSKFTLDERFSKITISVSSPTEFVLGDQSFNFSQGDDLVLSNYDGKISTTNKTSHYRIEGSASKANLKGITMSADEGKEFDVLSTNASLNSINATNVSLGNFEQNTSGKINVGNNVFKPQNELTIIESFVGDLSLSSGKIVLKGKAESLEIKGESDISVSK